MLHKLNIYRVIIFIRIDLSLRTPPQPGFFFFFSYRSFSIVSVSLRFLGEIGIEISLIKIRRDRDRYRDRKIDEGQGKKRDYHSVSSELLVAFCVKYQHHELSLKLWWCSDKCYRCDLHSVLWGALLTLSK